MDVQTDSDAAAVWAHGKPVLRLRMAMPPSSRQMLDRQLMSVLRSKLRQQIAHATEVSKSSSVFFLYFTKSCICKNAAGCVQLCVCQAYSLIPEQQGSSCTLEHS